jgi:fructoselysine-6-P-deglycase FrlB-like protein
VGSTTAAVTINADAPLIQTGTSTIQYGVDLKRFL